MYSINNTEHYILNITFLTSVHVLWVETCRTFLMQSAQMYRYDPSSDIISKPQISLEQSVCFALFRFSVKNLHYCLHQIFASEKMARISSIIAQTSPAVPGKYLMSTHTRDSKGHPVQEFCFLSHSCSFGLFINSKSWLILGLKCLLEINAVLQRGKSLILRLVLVPEQNKLWCICDKSLSHSWDT